ncbi:mechanosensitive ion channel family protein [Lysobacter pythonis]|uniref:Small-conductance mechanosensitive channel n=1 Tax=Solilutibacter pythonis TaxID=2483112 RepID=A0A3M2HYQ2_9GAMM|nr:mechanosensitive ion channel domain-containing protein [Lysobacter pythonis]RMH94861.1 mechanosensitive ion channel family protein [Lysobacter pythonis]
MQSSAPNAPATATPTTLQHWFSANLADKALDLVAALAIALVGWWLARRLVGLLDRVLGRFQVDTILSNFLRNVAFATLMVVVVIAALQQLGIPTTSLLAMVGAAGLAIGLALKDSLSNIASGVMLIMLRPFKAGDSIRIGGIEGVVEQVRIFTTFLRTYQNELIVLPNSEITRQAIVNLTHKPVRRVDVAVGIGYGNRIDHARKVLLELAANCPMVLKSPATVVLATDLGENSVNLSLRAWCKPDDFLEVRSELIEAVHREFATAGISIPYPQRDLHVYHQDADGKPLGELLKSSVPVDAD